MQNRKNVRNFSIIAHIDHGKSTLADRMIQLCGGLTQREMADQVLDTLDLERERGITIKAQSVTLNYHADDGQVYELNFIDTPGHVDFSYEVSRSLSACEGALLVVDAAQGVEAQTAAVCYMAVDQDLVVIPVLNKIDLPQADADKVVDEIEEVIGIEAHDALQVSAKSGQNVHQVLESLVRDIPAPEGDPDKPLQALIVDSWYDSYLGVVSLVRIKEGTLKRHEKIRVMSTGMDHTVSEVGIFSPKRQEQQSLQAGDVGYVIAGIKAVDGAPVGDTLTHAKAPASERLPGFQQIKPHVYCGLFPMNSNEYEIFRDALSKLRLNDASLFYEPESSSALGFGFRCGFLGMLHMEIIKARLEREYGLNLITTAPTVVYEVVTKKGDVLYIDNPTHLPSRGEIEEIREPVVELNILTPDDYVGPVIQMCVDKRGDQKNMVYTGNQVSLTYHMPLSEVVLDFFDRLKSITRGYASMDYHFLRYRAEELVKMDILVNGDPVDALSCIVHRDQAYQRGKAVVEKLKELIPRQMYEVALQAAIGSHVIARETVKAMRKNVTAKCYGGDVTRKRKLLEKQKEGKKRMKQVGKAEIPQEAFMAVLRVDDSEKKS